MSSWAAELPLVGAGGEKVDLWRTFLSHGLADLPPMRVDEEARSFETTLAPDGARPRIVRVSPGRAGYANVRVVGRAPGAKSVASLLASVRHVLRLDEDLSEFYGLAAADPELEWATDGAGRMVRSPTVFEDVVKTICTTNCAWSATERMVGALVTHLGEPAPGASADGPYGRAFPTPEAMAEAGEDFYRDVVRAGYRGRYLKELAASVAAGTVPLEELGRAAPDELSDDDVSAHLLALPGVGPYAAAHIMMLLGRYSRLILDSWTPPGAASERLGDRAPLPPLRPLRRPRLLALPHAGLGRRPGPSHRTDALTVGDSPAMRRLALFALIAGAIAVVVRALRRDDIELVEAGGEPVAASVGHASVGPVEKQEAEEPPSGPAETPGTTAPPL